MNTQTLYPPVNASSQHSLLAELEQQVEDLVQITLADFQTLSPRLLVMPSAEGGWSIVQCLEHLNTYGRWYLPRIDARLNEAGGNVPAFKSTWMGRYFRRMMDPDTGTKKRKALRRHVPTDTLSPVKVIGEFTEQLETLLQQLRRAESANLNRRIATSLSPMITLTLGDTFGFLVAHIRRHVQQARRNLKMP